MCTACGKRFLGNAAHGRNGRYRYYTCFSRQRYGPDTCSADRLPAGELDDAVFDSLLATYQRADLFDRVANDAATRAQAAAQRQRGDLANVQAELDKAERAVERYLLAFEAGTLPESQCGQRIHRTLGSKIADLRDRETELRESLRNADLKPPTLQQLTDTRDELRAALDETSDRKRKTLLQALVHEVRVQARDHIKPVFRVPFTADQDAVRPLVGTVLPTGFEPAPPA